MDGGILEISLPLLRFNINDKFGREDWHCKLSKDDNPKLTFLKFKNMIQKVIKDKMWEVKFSLKIKFWPFIPSTLASLQKFSLKIEGFYFAARLLNVLIASPLD